MSHGTAISDVLEGRSRWGVAVGDSLASLRAMPAGDGGRGTQGEVR